MTVAIASDFFAKVGISVSPPGSVVKDINRVAGTKHKTAEVIRPELDRLIVVDLVFGKMPQQLLALNGNASSEIIGHGLFPT
ncbi:MAG: hypothetical protein ABR529_09085, partial [Actinomycetota bacterium]